MAFKSLMSKTLWSSKWPTFSSLEKLLNLKTSYKSTGDCKRTPKCHVLRNWYTRNTNNTKLIKDSRHHRATKAEMTRWCTLPTFQDQLKMRRSLGPAQAMLISKNKLMTSKITSNNTMKIKLQDVYFKVTLKIENLVATSKITINNKRSHI